MPLYQRQLDAIQALDWIFDPSDESRRTGRTTALVISAIRAACRYPGRYVIVLDHADIERGLHRHMMQGMLASDPSFEGRVRWRGNRAFAINLAAPIPDWMPPETFFVTGGELPFSVGASGAPQSSPLTERSVDAPPPIVRITVWERLRAILP